MQRRDNNNTSSHTYSHNFSANSKHIPFKFKQYTLMHCNKINSKRPFNSFRQTNASAQHLMRGNILCRKPAKAGWIEKERERDRSRKKNIKCILKHTAEEWNGRFVLKAHATTFYNQETIDRTSHTHTNTQRAKCINVSHKRTWSECNARSQTT